MELGALFLVVLDLIRHRFRVSPSRVVAWVMLFYACLGGIMWNSFAVYGGAGLPSNNYSIIGLGSPAGAAFLCIASGFLVASLVSVKFPKISKSFAFEVTPTQSRLMPLLSLFLLVLWTVGEGLSVFSRDEYLASNGIETIQKITGFICPFTSAAIFFFILRFQPERNRLNMIMGFVWTIFLAGVGTRVSVIFVFVWVAAEIGRTSKVSTVTALKKCFTLFTGFIFFVALFNVSVVSRSVPHGVGRLYVTLFGPQGQAYLTWESVNDSLGQVAASVFAGYPIVEETIGKGPELKYLLSNANPLPSFISDTSSYTKERLWPFEWVPQAFWGQIYGAGGFYTTFLIALLIGYFSNYFYRKALANESYLESNFILALTIMVGFIGTQYPSRSFFRLASFIFFVPASIAMLRYLSKRIATDLTVELVRIRQRRVSSEFVRDSTSMLKSPFEGR